MAGALWCGLEFCPTSWVWEPCWADKKNVAMLDCIYPAVAVAGCWAQGKCCYTTPVGKRSLRCGRPNLGFPDPQVSSHHWKQYRGVRGSEVHEPAMGSPGLGAPKLLDIQVLCWPRS